MIEKHIIQLEVKDSVSPALKKVGDNAEKAGRQAEDAGRRGTRSSQDWAQAAGKVGLALGAVGAIAIKLGNESEVVQTRLEQSIENTGAAYGDLKDQIDQASKAALNLAFDDEDALNAISRLTDATGNAETAINDLAIAQDIARARGISLAAATDIVIAAETGRFRSLKALGIVLDESATKEDYLAALQERYAGQAEAYASTNAATWDKVGNTIENKLETLGGALADFQGPLIALGAGAQVIGPLGDAFASIGGKAALAQKGTAALALAMGPVGLGLAAVATVAALAITVFNKANDDTTLSVDEATESVRTFNEAIGDLGNAGASTDITQSASELSPIYQQLATDVAYAQTQLEDLNDTIVVDDAQIKAIQDAQKAFETMILTETELADVQSDTIELLRHQGINAEQVTARVKELYAAYDAGTLSAKDLAWNLNWLNDNSASYGLTLEELGRQQTDAAKAIEYTANAYTASLPVIEQYVAAVDTMTDAYEFASTEWKASVPVIATLEAQIANATSGIGEASGATVTAARNTSDYNDQLAKLADTLKMDFAGAAGAAYNRSVGFTDSIVSSIQTTKDWTDAMTGVMGTDFMDDGTWSKLAQMVQDGTLDQEDYTEALESQEQIYKDLTRAQEASAEIQIKQADAMADGTKASADYLENIAAMDEAEQGLALAWADSDIAGRAMEVAGLASEFGNMNDAQQAAFSDMVTSAAATDPALADVLADLGLIKESTTDPTGWTLSIDETEAKASLDDVSGGIGALIEVLAVAYNLNVDAILEDSQFWADYNSIPTDKYTTVHFVGVREGIGWDSGGYALGGVTKYEDYDTAALGRVSGGAMTLVGEHGPELVNLPGGSLVTPNHATMYRSEAKGGGGITINGPITVVANDPQSFIRQLRQSATTLERR